MVSHSSTFGRHLSSCSLSCPYHRSCSRYYSNTDARWGLDNDNTWYFGHTLYMLCYRNSKLKGNLPLPTKFTDARYHNSKNFFYAIDNFGHNNFGPSTKKVCLDSTHDNIPTYTLLEHLDMNALMDINSRTKSSPDTPDVITFNKQGHPLCKAGHEMCPREKDYVKDARKYHCPLKCSRIGE